jgi:hypothetical protein
MLFPDLLLLCYLLGSCGCLILLVTVTSTDRQLWNLYTTTQTKRRVQENTKLVQVFYSLIIQILYPSRIYPNDSLSFSKFHGSLSKKSTRPFNMLEYQAFKMNSFFSDIWSDTRCITHCETFTSFDTFLDTNKWRYEVLMPIEFLILPVLF